MPTNPQSSFQTAVRGNFADLSTGWRTLTDLQKEGWITLGEAMERQDSLGQTYTLTGIQAYISVNNNLLTVGGTPVANAPAYQLPDHSSPYSFASAAGAGTVTLTYTPPDPGDFILVYATRPMSDGRMFAAKSEYKLIDVADESDASPLSLGSEYSARFGSITGKAGEKIFFRLIRISAAGFASTPLQTSAIIAA